MSKVDWKAKARQHREQRPLEQMRTLIGVTTCGDHDLDTYRNVDDPRAMRLHDLICPCGQRIGLDPYVELSISRSPTHSACVTLRHVEQPSKAET